MSDWSTEPSLGRNAPILRLRHIEIKKSATTGEANDETTSRRCFDAFIYEPFARFAFTKAVLVSEKRLAVKARYFLAGEDIAQNSDASRVAASRHEATVGSTIWKKEGGFSPTALNICNNKFTGNETLPWFINDAGPSHSCAQFFRVENITLKSLRPGTKRDTSSWGVSSAMHPTSKSILSFLYLYDRGYRYNCTCSTNFALALYLQVSYQCLDAVILAPPSSREYLVQGSMLNPQSGWNIPR